MCILKKLITFTFLTFVSLNMGSVIAGDIPEALMTGDQKAHFIGLLLKDADQCTLIPKTIMMGDISNDPIKVDCFDKYYGTSDKPKDGDIIVAILNNDLTLDSWIFKVTSEDYRSLKLVSERYNMAERYEKYINEGRYFRDSDLLVKESNLPTKESDYSKIYLGIAIISLLGIIFYLIKHNKSKKAIIGLLFLIAGLLILWLFNLKNNESESLLGTTEQSEPIKIVYLKPENSSQISDEDLKKYSEILVVNSFEDLEKNVTNKVAIWIDKDSVDLIKDEWLNQEPQKYYPLVLIGYNNALYSFRDKLSLGGIKGPQIDWSTYRLEPGFSTWMFSDSKRILKGFDRDVSVEAILIETRNLSNEESYKIVLKTNDDCLTKSDCALPFEYAIRSDCPYETRCLKNECCIICPIIDPNWNKIEQAIYNCDVDSVMQTHDKNVVVKLKNGGTIEAFEPNIDDVIFVADKAEEKCGKLTIGTE